MVSVPGARAAVLRADEAGGPPEAFMVGREFAHLHPHPDSSLHLNLPADRAAEAIAAGWAEHHYLVAGGQLPPTVVMVFAPRDADELEVVWTLVQDSHRFASGVG
jgi:phospholipase/carboxylesterase